MCIEGEGENADTISTNTTQTAGYKNPKNCHIISLKGF